MGRRPGAGGEALSAAKTPPPCRFCGRSQEHHAPDCPRPVVHSAGLVPSTETPTPPYLRFERKHAADFMVWIAAPPHDVDTVNAAMNTPEGRAMSAVRVLVDFFGYSLTPEESALLARFELKDTGPDFWAAVAAAGLVYVPPAPEEKKLRPQGPAAVGTYPELAVIGFAASDARTGDHWKEAPGGGALVHTRKKAGLQVRFAPSVGGDRWADPLPGALSDDLFAILSANGGLDSVFLAQVGADLAIEHEHEDVSLDDLGRLIGRDPRTTKDREAMRRDLWKRLKFLDGITVHGARRGTYRDPSTRKQVPIESRDALFLISGAMWPEQGTLDGSDVPLKVKFGAGPLLATYRGRPEVLTSFGEYRRLAAIPGEKVSGAWARSMGLALTQRWRELASYGKAQKLTRRYLLAQFPPAPTVDEVLAEHDAGRARRYFTQALALLKTNGVIAAYAEPDPKTLPRYGWAAVWCKQTVDVTQPAPALEAGASMQATREEAEEKATRGRKRRPKKTAPAPE